MQALIFRANMLMRRFRWVALEVQTMGLESSQQGHQVAAPLARVDEAIAIARYLLPMTLPDRFESVSRLTIRRVTIRYSMLLAAATLGAFHFWETALWGLLLLPLVPVYAYFHYKNHGYALVDDKLFIRRGVFRHYIWIIPVSKFQVLYTTASFFQRRLGLATVYVDTAGAGVWALPEIIDVAEDVAGSFVQACYARFRASFE